MIEFLNEINQLLKKILNETLKIETQKSDCQKFYYEILFINLNTFEGAIFLLSQYKNRPLFQIPYVSIMRDLISDLIIAEYISHKENDTSANIEIELEKIYSEHYRFTKKSKKLEKVLFGTNENHDSYEDEFERLGKKYNGDDGELKGYLKNISSIYDRIKYIESRQKKDDKENVRILYLWYTNFSKISHFGELTLSVIESKFASDNEKEVFENHFYLLNVVIIFFVGLLEKICFNETIDQSIHEDLNKLWEFKVGT